MFAVLYQIDGTIVQFMTGQRHIFDRTAEVMCLEWIQVEEQRDDYDRLYVVNHGKLALKGTITEAN